MVNKLEVVKVNAFSYILPLGMGALIGYVTNWIAIKMLFRPHKAKFFGKIRIPFTPGLIPKERNRIAKSISETIVQYLLTDQIMIKELESEKFCNGLRNFLDRQIKRINTHHYSIGEFVEEISEESNTDILKIVRSKINDSIHHLQNDEQLKKQLAVQLNGMLDEFVISQDLNDILGDNLFYYVEEGAAIVSPKIIAEIKEIANSEEISNKITAIIKEEIDKKMGNLGFLGVLGSGMFSGNTISTMVINKINELLNEEETEKTVKKFIMEYILQHKDKKLEELVPEEWVGLVHFKVEEILEQEFGGDTTTKWMEVLITQIFEKLLKQPIYLSQEVSDSISSAGIKVYRVLVSKYFPQVLKAIDLASIIEKEINAFDIEDLETIIFQVAKKELSAITRLGAIIGFILAGIMLLF